MLGYFAGLNHFGYSRIDDRLDLCRPAFNSLHRPETENITPHMRHYKHSHRLGHSCFGVSLATDAQASERFPADVGLEVLVSKDS